MPDLKAVRPDAANEERARLERQRGVVDRRRVERRLPEGEAQLWQVSHPVGLTARRLEQDRRPDPPVDVFERVPGIDVEGTGVGVLAGDVGVDRRQKAGLAELSENNPAKLRNVQRRRAKRDQGLAAGLLEGVAVGPGDPLGEHRQGAAGLLVLWQRLPLALEDREGRRMERVARVETLAEQLPRGRLGRRGVDGGPLRR